jgi:hypothetical protein
VISILCDREQSSSKIVGNTHVQPAAFAVKYRQEKLAMIKTVEALVDNEGRVRLLKPVHLGSTRRALVVILDEPEILDDETALLSEPALSDWSRPEEDAAWSHLQLAK